MIHQEMHGTLGLSHGTWHLIMLVVAVILILSLFAGIGKLVQDYYKVVIQGSKEKYASPPLIPQLHNEEEARNVAISTLSSLDYEGKVTSVKYDETSGKWEVDFLVEGKPVKVLVRDLDLSSEGICFLPLT